MYEGRVTVKRTVQVLCLLSLSLVQGVQAQDRSTYYQFRPSGTGRIDCFQFSASTHRMLNDGRSVAFDLCQNREGYYFQWSHQRMNSQLDTVYCFKFSATDNRMLKGGATVSNSLCPGRRPVYYEFKSLNGSPLQCYEHSSISNQVLNFGRPVSESLCGTRVSHGIGESLRALPAIVGPQINDSDHSLVPKAEDTGDSSSPRQSGATAVEV